MKTTLMMNRKTGVNWQLNIFKYCIHSFLRRKNESVLMEEKVGPEGSSMEAEGQSNSGGSDFEELAENRIPKVRIGAAELATDILMIGVRKVGEK